VSFQPTLCRGPLPLHHHSPGLNGPNSSSIRAAEAREIVSGPANTNLPVIFTCDCNSTPMTQTHRALVAGGLRDTWTAVHPHLAGLTCCHRGSPSDRQTDVADPHPSQGIVERIDYIWSRAPLATHGINLVGTNPADRAPVTAQDFPSKFNAPWGGTLTETWYSLLRNRTSALIARGTTTVPNAAPTTIDSILTAAGRHLLAATRAQLKIAVVASFASFVGNEVTVTNRITLRP
jgi:hypothetical protein